jgi:hypothetical protein
MCGDAKVCSVHLTLEDFAKLFTYGICYTMEAAAGKEAPTNVLWPATQTGSADK